MLCLDKCAQRGRGRAKHKSRKEMTRIGEEAERIKEERSGASAYRERRERGEQNRGLRADHLRMTILESFVDTGCAQERRQSSSAIGARGVEQENINT
eukprot:6183576-Pleurochrysis_carterae.AAC.2